MKETEMEEMCARTHSEFFKNSNFFQRRLSNAMRAVQGIPMDFSDFLKEELWHIKRI